MEVKIKVITYEQDRLEYFTNLMKHTQKTYNRLYKKFKDAPYLSAEAQVLSDAGRETQFLTDVVEMLENGYRKQSEVIDDFVERLIKKSKSINTAWGNLPYRVQVVTVYDIGQIAKEMKGGDKE